MGHVPVLIQRDHAPHAARTTHRLKHRPGGTTDRWVADVFVYTHQRNKVHAQIKDKVRVRVVAINCRIVGACAGGVW